MRIWVGLFLFEARCTCLFWSLGGSRAGRCEFLCRKAPRVKFWRNLCLTWAKNVAKIWRKTSTTFVLQFCRNSGRKEFPEKSSKNSMSHRTKLFQGVWAHNEFGRAWSSLTHSYVIASRPVSHLLEDWAGLSRPSLQSPETAGKLARGEVTRIICLGDKIQGPSWGQHNIRKPRFVWHILDSIFIEFFTGRPRGGDNFTALFQVLQTVYSMRKVA